MTKLRGDTSLDLNNFYNHINMCLNALTRIQEDLLPDYQSIKRRSELEEYFIPDSDNPDEEHLVMVKGTWLDNKAVMA